METKKKLPLPLLILIVGVGIGLLFGGVGLFKQLDSKRVNKERYNNAYKQSETAVKAANERLAQIETEYNAIKTKFNEKALECDSIVTGSDNWFVNKNQCLREKQELQDQLWNLESEDKSIKAKDYTVYYQKVKPMSYLIFYIIGGSIAFLAALGAFIIYLVKGKKSYY